MAKTVSRRTSNIARSPNLGPPPPARVSPFKEIGSSGYAVFGGRVLNREKDHRVAGQQRWVTYDELVVNTSIVAAGVRYFLNIVAHAKWSVEPAKAKEAEEPTAEAKKIAEFVDSVINEMETPWRRVARRAAMYRFNGYGVQEWTAKRRESDGKIGLDDIEARPCHTMDHWEVDEGGTVLGLWQRSPQTGQLVWLPRQKVLYLVEDSMTDSPEGLGLYRHMVDPYLRLQRYQNLEGLGFDRDLRGIPIGRIPYAALADAVKKGTLEATRASQIVSALEEFVRMQTKKEDTSICLDSATYTVETDSGPSISGIYQYGLELLQGQQPGFGDLNAAVQRLNRELARVIGVEHLLLGESSGSRALSEDKSRNFYLTLNGTLDDLTDGAQKDIVNVVCDLNGIPEELRPKLKHSDISFRSVAEITGSLREMATAGAVLQPNDPAIDDIRDMLGLPKAPEMSPEMLGLLSGALPPGGDKKKPEDDEPGVQGVENKVNQGKGKPKPKPKPKEADDG